MCRKIHMKLVILKNKCPTTRKDQLTMNTVYNRESVWYKKPPNKYHIKYRNYIEAKNTYKLLTLV